MFLRAFAIAAKQMGHLCPSLGPGLPIGFQHQPSRLLFKPPFLAYGSPPAADLWALLLMGWGDQAPTGPAQPFLLSSSLRHLQTRSLGGDPTAACDGLCERGDGSSGP